MDDIVNTGFNLERHPGVIALGITFSKDVFKTNYGPDAKNCVRYWFCIHFLCWLLSYTGVRKAYGIKMYLS